MHAPTATRLKWCYQLQQQSMLTGSLSASEFHWNASTLLDVDPACTQPVQLENLPQVLFWIKQRKEIKVAIG